MFFLSEHIKDPQIDQALTNYYYYLFCCYVQQYNLCIMQSCDSPIPVTIVLFVLLFPKESGRNASLIFIKNSVAL